MKYYIPVVNQQIALQVEAFLLTKGYIKGSCPEPIYYICIDGAHLGWDRKENKGALEEQGWKLVSLEDLDKIELNFVKVGNYTADIKADEVIANGTHISYEQVKSIVERMR